MPSTQQWLKMYASGNLDVKRRAATALLDRAGDTPLGVLVEILDTLSHQGLGAKTEQALLKRQDAALVIEMISRLESNDDFVREVACNVLGRLGDRTATPYLLGKVDDPSMMVRRAAAYGLAFLKDPSALCALRESYRRHQKDDLNVTLALQCALKSVGKIDPSM